MTRTAASRRAARGTAADLVEASGRDRARLALVEAVDREEHEPAERRRAAQRGEQPRRRDERRRADHLGQHVHAEQRRWTATMSATISARTRPRRSRPGRVARTASPAQRRRQPKRRRRRDRVQRGLRPRAAHGAPQVVHVRVPARLGAVRHAELAVRVGQVELDRLLGHPQLRGRCCRSSGPRRRGARISSSRAVSGQSSSGGLGALRAGSGGRRCRARSRAAACRARPGARSWRSRPRRRPRTRPPAIPRPCAA